MKKTLQYLLFLQLILSVTACNQYGDRIIKKKIELANGQQIEWYWYSLIGGYSVEYIDLKEQDKKGKHIYINPLICDINLRDDTLFVSVGKGANTIFYDTGYAGLKLKIDSLLYCGPNYIESEAP